MEREVSPGDEALVRQLGRSQPDLQVLQGCADSDLYTTNAIESLNATYRRLNSQRSVFPSDTALLKALYLATFEATKKWTMPIRNWGKVYGELAIMYDGRLPD